MILILVIAIIGKKGKANQKGGNQRKRKARKVLKRGGSSHLVQKRSKPKKELNRLNQNGQQRSKSTGSLLGSEQIPSKASARIVTGTVKVQSTSCQVPILFSTTDSWHEFDEQISKDVLDNKYSSCSFSYVCKGVDVLLTKSTWNIFLLFIKTQCPDQMVTVTTD